MDACYLEQKEYNMKDDKVIYTVCTIENLCSRPSPYGGHKPKDEKKRFSCKDIYEYLGSQQSSRTP